MHPTAYAVPVFDICADPSHRLEQKLTTQAVSGSNRVPPFFDLIRPRAAKLSAGDGCVSHVCSRV